MKILTVTSLYPNEVQPNHGIFVENRLRRIVGGGIEARVLAPVPWFPFSAGAFGRYARFARVPREETRCGIRVSHPRFPSIPKVGMSVAPLLMYAALERFLRRGVLGGYDFDLIDAHYFYPDGVAAALLGRRYRKPVVITARGSDINLIAHYAIPRRQIAWAAREAAAVIAVSEALKDRMIDLGIDPDRIFVLRNGVDLEAFRPKATSSAASRAEGGPILLSVGNLVAGKGHDLAIRALTLLEGAELRIAGDGPLLDSLRSLARSLSVAQRVRFLGRVPHERLPEVYGRADALILASAREGWPNVLLEAMACGTPVVATRVGGIPEIVKAEAAGVLVEDRSPDAIASAVKGLLAAPPFRAATRAYAEQFGWQETIDAQRRLYLRLAAGQRSEGPGLAASGSISYG